MPEKKVKVAKLSDFQEGTKKRIMLIQDEQKPEENEPLMLCMVEGKIYAVSDTCTHNRASLTAGKLCKYQIECAWHGARFDIRNGEVKALPAAMPLKVYRVLIEGDDICIEI